MNHTATTNTDGNKLNENDPRQINGECSRFLD